MCIPRNQIFSKQSKVLIIVFPLLITIANFLATFVFIPYDDILYENEEMEKYLFCELLLNLCYVIVLVCILPCICDDNDRDMDKFLKAT